MFLFILIDSNVCLWVRIGLYASIWILSGPYGSLLLLTSLWILMGRYGSFYVFIRPDGF